MKKDRIVIGVLIVLLCSTVGFIWSQSFLDIPASRTESKTVQEKVEPILEPVVGEGNVTNHLVRKLAHFIEFGCLGMELAVFRILKKSRRWMTISLCGLTAMVAALTDETIQLFSQRGSQIQDVWLDIAGAAFGFLLMTGILCGVVSLFRKKKSGEGGDFFL